MVPLVRQIPGSSRELEARILLRASGGKMRALHHDFGSWERIEVACVIGIKVRTDYVDNFFRG